MTPKLQNSELEFHRADLPSVEDLNRKQEWFCDPARVPADNAGPFVRVLDGFYSDPEAMRSLAVALPYAQYSPPLVEDVGEEIAARWKKPGRWLASVNFVFHGTRIEHAFPGTRANPGWLREKIAGFLGEEIERESWEWGGDGWNGAFHLIENEWQHSAIHHHYKQGDVDRRGWSGVVYLSPDAPASSGTSIWREKTTGRCVASLGAKFHDDIGNFERVLLIENRFNRLVLFRENVLHRGEHGFGVGKEARLTQSFFFRTVK